ncbi:NUDIX hydrolase [Nocardia stercoris]|uniref:NUDIX domain-containing protein n=1 Tax=Nocardia stercoris TaxID=2483361 RepID=A0A3M2L866_9NOCA|nr:NUDIX domain-containing protein [Nocardia stercoris]RMI33574.1 NUDIX domain-containing protein [Nocardia stercoris]
MTETVSVATAIAKPERHKVTGDVHLVLRRGGEVLFGQRRNTGFADGAWHLPAGHLEAGESVIDAVIREAEEEIGISIDPTDVQFAHIMHNSGSGGRMAFFFTVRTWQGDLENREPDKCSELQWFPTESLPDNMIDYCRDAMANISAGRPFSVFGW